MLSCIDFLSLVPRSTSSQKVTTSEQKENKAKNTTKVAVSAINSSAQSSSTSSSSSKTKEHWIWAWIDAFPHTYDDGDDTD